jgi:crotonobetainyl-CoA:carnitine CoA-transferase CaiB-like acyl-CoA transferase
MAVLPLSGIRIVDASVVVMGTYASQWRADLGADVLGLSPHAMDELADKGVLV